MTFLHGDLLYEHQNLAQKTQALALTTLKPCSDLWFADGNIILIVDKVAFKVHRGQLSRHSEVFEGLFSLPTTTTSSINMLYEGCMCVEMHGDSPMDMRFFLQALYDGLYHLPPYGPEFYRISGILRISAKYFVEPLRKLCYDQLLLDWPATLTQWDIRERLATNRKTGKYTPRDVCAHPILVIELALELGLRELLPAALYDLSRYGPSKIFAGTITADHSADPLASSSVVAAAKRLESSVLCWTLRGRQQAQIYMANFVQVEIQDRQPSRYCPRRVRKECRDSFYFIALNLLRAIGGIACGRDADPLFSVLQAVEMLTREDFSDGERKCSLNICVHCQAEFTDRCHLAREEIWSLLPVWFGLEPVGKDDELTSRMLQVRSSPMCQSFLQF